MAARGHCICVLSTWLVCCWCHVLSCLLSVPSHVCPLFLPHYCLSCSTCVSLITLLMFLPIYPPGVCNSVLIRCFTSQSPLQSQLLFGSPQSLLRSGRAHRVHSRAHPVREPSESTQVPAPELEHSETTQEPAPLKRWFFAPPWWHPALPAPPWHPCLRLSPGYLPLHRPGPQSLHLFHLLFATLLDSCFVPRFLSRSWAGVP